MEQQIKEMEKQIQQAEQGIPWERAKETNDSDPPPPGLDSASSSSSAGANVPNQQPERTKKRSSRYYFIIQYGQYYTIIAVISPKYFCNLMLHNNINNIADGTQVNPNQRRPLVTEEVLQYLHSIKLYHRGNKEIMIIPKINHLLRLVQVSRLLYHHSVDLPPL